MAEKISSDGNLLLLHEEETCRELHGNYRCIAGKWKTPVDTSKI
jgi:hypothetical protein